MALLTGLLLVALLVLFTLQTRAEDQATVGGGAGFDTPTNSSPIALAANNNELWVVNPDNDTVALLTDLDGTPQVVDEFFVGDEPQSVALSVDPDDANHYNVYVANAADNSVSILDFDNEVVTTVDTIVTGAEPWDIVASPDGQRIFVANSGQDTITMIRTDTNAVVGSVDLRDSACNDPDRNRIFQPRGLAVTLNNDRLYVTRFLSFTTAGGAQGSDEGKEGVVCQLNIAANLGTLPTVAGVVTLGAQATGFNIDANGDTVADPTFAFPNQLQSIVIRGNQAYLPNIAASPSKPLRFNVDTQAFVNVIDNAATGTPVDASADKFINLHLGAREPEAGKTKLFFANPWAIAFTNQSGAGNAYAVSAGSDLLVKLNVDASGVLSFTVDANTTRYIDLNDPANPATAGANAGKNPLGIVIRGDQAFVMNYISRNVSVVDLTTDAVVQVIQTGDLPPANTLAEQLLVGKEMFFSSRGHFDRPANTTVSTENRLSSEGWQNCGSCHFAGLTDGVIWQFVPGPRKSIPMNGTWSPHNPDDQRMLNYSAFFDEVEDFEINVRNVSGPGALAAPINGSVQDPNHGLLIGDDGNINNAPAAVNQFALPNAGRPQVTVTLPGSTTAWPALTALKEWIRFAIRTPNGALTTEELTDGGGATTGGLNPTAVAAGRRLFFRSGCHKCHGGTKWSISNKDFTSPPAAAEIFTEAGAPNNAFGGQFLDRFLSDIDSFNLGVAGQGNELGNNVGAVELAANGQTALGADHNGDGKGDGFNIPSLLAISYLPPYYHNGACETLACVLSNTTHRQAGLRAGQEDPLATELAQDRVVTFLETLDADTDFPLNLYVDPHDIFTDPPKPFKGSTAVVGANISLFGTKADLQGLMDDLGISSLEVRITADPGLAPTVLQLTPDDFRQDFGQAVITTTWNIPANAIGTRAQVSVFVDAGDDLLETQEADNIASRTVQIRAPKPDTTRPVVSDVAISDDDPFNAADVTTASQDVRIRFKASDVGDGLDAFCVVSYTYDVVRRRWIEQSCQFETLPAPESGTTDTFVVDATLQPKRGVAYAFVWVRDKAGNISRRPGFDVITFLTNDPIELNRNDVLILRLPLPSGNLQLDVDVEFGDVDVSVFDDFVNANATRCALSANNGTAAEQIVLPGSCPASPGRFQVEIRAVVYRRFTVSVNGTVTEMALAAAAQNATANAALLAEPATPLVGGPPALLAAIDDDEDGGGTPTIYLPLVQR
jgi:YVTN family beta-propeller protein